MVHLSQFKYQRKREKLDKNNVKARMSHGLGFSLLEGFCTNGSTLEYNATVYIMR